MTEEIMNYLAKVDLPYYCVHCGAEFNTAGKLMEHDCPVKLAKMARRRDEE